MIRVVIADDQQLFRATLRILIDTEPDMTVVGEAGDGSAAVAATHDTRPDVVLMDVRMPVMDGVEATRAITTDPTVAASRILVLTAFEIDEHVEAAIRAGATGFVGKDIEPDKLLGAIRAVAAGDPALSSTASRLLINQFRSGKTIFSVPLPGLRSFDELTPREREIVAMAAVGRTNQDIARELTISTLTVKTHINRAMAKIGARDRAQLVAHAHYSGLV